MQKTLELSVAEILWQRRSPRFGAVLRVVVYPSQVCSRRRSCCFEPSIVLNSLVFFNPSLVVSLGFGLLCVDSLAAAGERIVYVMDGQTVARPTVL